MSLLIEVGKTFHVPMVLVSHRADETIGLTDWAIRLEEGKVIAAGPSAGLLRDSETHVDNYLTGRVVGPGRIDIEGLELTAMVPAGTAGKVRVACYAHEVLLASRAPEGLSARNVFPVTVTAVPREGDPLLLEIGPPRLRVLVTREALETLGLGTGSRAHAVVKATSLVYLGAA
jgi:molybdate transport system ATP-binding protein